MADFIAYISNDVRNDLDSVFQEAKTVYKNTLGCEDVTINNVQGATILMAYQGGRRPYLYEEKGVGWLLVKGIVLDMQNDDEELNYEKMHRCLFKKTISDYNQYEGTFALVGWSVSKSEAIIVNDQASVLNLYYYQKDGRGIYVTTNAMVLAKALRIGVNPVGIHELLARNKLLAPTTMFDGINRLSIGQHIVFKKNKIKIKKHWDELNEGHNNKRSELIVNDIVEVLAKRLKKYLKFNESCVFDLTGGFDTRLLIASANYLNYNTAVTVNGMQDDANVKIAKKIATLMGYEFEFFNKEKFINYSITPEIRKKLTYRINGEAPFSSILPQYLSKPELGKKYSLSVMGSGGEFLRHVPWRKEKFQFWSKTVPNIDKLIKKHFAFKNKYKDIYRGNDWYKGLEADLNERLLEMCGTNKKLQKLRYYNAIYLYRLTSHSSIYVSSTYSWIPSVAPLLTSGFLNLANSLPCHLRFNSQLQRKVITKMSPYLAKIETDYGGTSEPIKIKSLRKEFKPMINRLVDITDRHILNGAISRKTKHRAIKSPPENHASDGNVNFVTKELKNFLNPDKMLSRKIYDHKRLENYLNKSFSSKNEDKELLVRIATIEQICMELNYEVEDGFMDIY